MLSNSEKNAIYASSPYISSRLNVAGVMSSLALSTLAAVVLVIAFGMKGEASAFQIGLFALGFIVLGYSFYRLSNKSKETIYVPTKSLTKQSSLFFDLKYIDELKSCVNTGNFQPGMDLPNEVTGNIRMDVIISQDKKFAAVQLFQFVPYEYKALTQVHYFMNGEVKPIADFIAKCK